MKCRIIWRNTIICMGIFLLALILIAFLLVRLKSHKPCGFANSREFMHGICHSYKEQIIGGQICPILCKSTWRLRTCLGHFGGKRVLLFQRDTSKPIDEAISRLSNPHITSLVAKSSQWTVQYGQGKVEPRLTWLEQTRKILTSAVAQVFLRHPDSDEIMREFWDQPLLEGEAPPPAILKNSVWALSEQREYILLKHISSGDLAPPVLGTCGPLYAVIDAPPPPELRVGALTLRSHPIQSLERRIELSIEIIRLLQNLELRLRPPLLLCDMKADNFGVAADGSLRLLDLDTVLVVDDLFSRECLNNDDCSLFACRGECVDGHCRKQKGFSLLQSACRNIFSPASINSWQGLLSSSPSSVTPVLNAALESCLNPAPDKVLKVAYTEMEQSLMRAIFLMRIGN